MFYVLFGHHWENASKSERQFQWPLTCTTKNKKQNQEPLAVASLLFLTSNLQFPSTVYTIKIEECACNVGLLRAFHLVCFGRGTGL